MATKFNELFDGDVNKGITELITLVKELQKELKVLAQGKSKDILSISSEDVASLQKGEKTLSEVTALMKESEKLKKTQIQLNARLETQRTQEAQGVAETRNAIQGENRALRNNAKRRTEAIGSLNRLRATLNEAKRRWDALSASERNNAAIGGRLLKVINRTEKEVRRLEKTTGRAQRNVGNYSSALNKTRGALLKVGAAAGITFGISALGNQIKEAIEMAGRLEGVQAAFNRLNRPGLLSELQEATAGTVTNLKLMQNAVQAKNLGLPVEKLGTFFEFARRRAQETGESVEFLTNSIVTGIGRKSVLILDNLGISATDLRDRMKETGDFGEAAALIIQEELANMGDDIDTSAQKTARLAATFENVKTIIGTALVPVVNALTGALQSYIESIGEAVQETQDMQKAGQKLSEIGDALTRSLEDTRKLGLLATRKELTLLGFALNEAEDRFGKTSEEANQVRIRVQLLLVQLKLLRAEQEAANKATGDQVVTLEALNEELTDLRKELQVTEVASENFVRVQEEIVRVENEIAKALGKETEAQKKARIEREKASKQLEKDMEKDLKRFLELQGLDDERIARAEQAEIDLAELIATTQEARIEAVNLQRDKDLEDLDLTEEERILIISQSLKDIDDIEKEFAEKKEDRDKKAAEDQEKLRKEQLEAAKELFDAIADLQKDASENRIKLIDEDIKASEKRVSRLRSLADQQSEDVKENLAFEQAEQARLMRDREREVQRQKNIEIGLAAIQTFSAKTQAGDSNPLVSSIRDITLLLAFIRSIGSFLEGTDNTGRGGTLDADGGMAAILHPNEKVFKSDHVDRLGGRTNEQVVHDIEAIDRGNISGILDQPKLSTYQFQSNDSIMEGFKSLEKAVRDSTPDIPSVKWDYDSLEKAVIQTVKTRNGTERNHKKVGRLF